MSSGRQEDTLSDQLAWARETARANGWTISREFDGVASGNDGVRRILTDLIAELRATPKAARPARVLMVRLDRLGRGDGLDTLAAVAELRKLGVMLHTRDRGDVSIRSATDTLVPYIDAITAARENEVRSEKSRSMHARKRAAGEPVGITPYGFALIEQRHRPYDPEAAFVRELFALRARGWSFGKISAYARVHAPPKHRQDGSNVAMRWAPSTLIRLLQNPVYRGAIVDVEVFDGVQRSWRRTPIATKEPKHPWPLRGALRCTCGLRVTGRVSGGTPRSPKTRYYVCPDPAAHGGYPGHRADRVEAQFAALLERIAAPEAVRDYAGAVEDPAALRTQSARLARELAAIDARRRRAWEIAEEAGIDGAELRARLEQIDADRARLTSALDDLRARTAAAATAQTLAGSATRALARAAAIWATAPIELQHEIAHLVSAVVGGLWLDPERRGALLSGLHGGVARKSDDGITKKFIQTITE